MISIVDSLITNLPLSATFLGLTINAWGGNISGYYIIFTKIILFFLKKKDTINATIAAKSKKTEFLTGTIIGS